MKTTYLMAALLALAGLAGCEKTTNVNPPATSTVVTPAATTAPADTTATTTTKETTVVPVPVPGPQGPAGEKGDKGDKGEKGDTPPAAGDTSAPQR